MTSPSGRRRAGDDRADAVDVALHEVAAEPGGQVAARSRLTGVAGGERAERGAVAASRFITSAVNVPPAISTTVRQTPLTAIESPCAASAVTVGAADARRAASPCQVERDDLAELLDDAGEHSGPHLSACCR